ncbi:MAG: hypothetical protein C7K11_07030 [Candidatus Amulumruptor caecigallinarius]|uniref:LPS assembly lipoprotein LptE n=1 Tax=Candidatus Amulumruptor caecigallinarius TaxID=2109911 RepID=A0A4Q0U7X5_9BACT|nr:MAG: hypothetical protein C7K11_07030 [Candidatus Amulumruptor caecigallinarius]HJE39649.1 LPS assembly lipoprotein LptE [Candidatus Amulumruptor caecigallinarius]
MIHKLIRLIPLKLAVVSTIMLMIPTACSISYKLNGAALDYSLYKTVYIGQFPIRAALVYAPLQSLFENSLTDYVRSNTRLQVVDGQADLDLTGEITGYTLTPQSVNENAVAAQTRLTITVRVKYTDHKDESKDVDQTFSAYYDFDSSYMLTDIQDQACEDITNQLVTLIFNATLGNW